MEIVEAAVHVAPGDGFEDRLPERAAPVDGAVAGTKLLDRRAVSAAVPISGSPEAQPPAAASLFQSPGAPSRSNLNSDLRARSKPVTKAAPFVNGDALADRL